MNKSGIIKKIIFRIIIIAACFFGYFLIMESVLYDLYSQKEQTVIMSDYIDTIPEETDIDRMLKDAEEYNKEIATYQKKEPFRYRGETLTDDKYESLLSLSEAMCCLNIPEISVVLPVAHGTHTDKLSYEAGHLYGTSLPIGGESTHAVIAAHSALSTAKLFTDLNKLDIGDEFFITVMGTTHRYVVDQIAIELPDVADEKLQVIDGKDYVTLYTCTPYAVNTHRLLVRGQRDLTYVSDKTVVEQKKENEHAYKIIDIKIASIIGAPFVLLIVYIIVNLIRFIVKRGRNK